MEALYVVNPVAGRGRALRAFKAVQEICKERYVFTDAPMHATEIARLAAKEGIPLVVAVGGDGTVHEVANGLACTGTALGVIPAGKGNDFARSLGIPFSPHRAVRLISSGCTRVIDLGMVDGRYFLNVSGVGFDAEVAQEVNSSERKIGGPLTYILGVLKMLSRYDPVPVEIALDGDVIRERILVVAIGNTPYYAAGMKMVPHARPDDGEFGICVAGNLTKAETLAMLPLVYSGRHISHNKVSTYKAARVEIRSETALAIQADGEIVGHLPAVFTVAAGCLRVIAPKGDPGVS
ncbi:MAG: diacylglycerol kinase family protein [Bacillota bacterium]